MKHSLTDSQNSNSKGRRTSNLSVQGGFSLYGRTVTRRCFLGTAGFLAGGLASNLPLIAGPFVREDFERLVPAEKKLRPEWVDSLFARGTPTVYRWPESKLIGMPIGGVCSGQIYLGGDGRLWHWDIFNLTRGTSDSHYAHPPEPESPIESGFAIKVRDNKKSQTRKLDHTDWQHVEFCGQYPIGIVRYSDPAALVSVCLEAYSPFIPLNTQDSALPATILEFTVQNETQSQVDIELAGWLENGVCLSSASEMPGARRNQILDREQFLMLDCSAEVLPVALREEKRPDIVVDDFERSTYAPWKSSGTAFGAGPVAEDSMPSYQGKVGAHGKRLVNSHASAPGQTVAEKDSATGTLISGPFVIERDYINFLVGGGAHAGRTCMNLRVDGTIVLSATGRNDNRLGPRTWDVRKWAGKTAQIEIVDNESGGWGNIGVDNIVLSDTPTVPFTPLAEKPDYGTMGLAIVRAGAVRDGQKDFASSVLSGGRLPDIAFGEGGPATVSRPFGERLIGSVGRRFRLDGGESAKVVFVLTWHFPNLKIDGLGDHKGRYYGTRFAHARAVSEYIVAHLSRLSGQTKLWRDTWHDSTLPHWFLERTMAPTSHLATNTCYWLGNGRFYAWEGVGCCAGTCAHVWHYAQAMARLFPELERSVREMADYGAGFDAASGRIRFRAEHNDHWAVDGQAGCILRVLREHQMSADNAFLRRLWPKVKKSLEFLISKDNGKDGIIDGPQHNTLDADWYGEVAWLSGLYLAALRAGEEMAREMGDADFADQCRAIFERGRKTVDERLFNGEYYIQRPDPDRKRTVGSYDGCEIDQVLGDSWAWQVGLGRILDEAHVRSALRSLWRYNFTPDVGPYRKAYPAGRWYALAGEAGLLMCTWPHGESQRVTESFDFYFNECMTGFEYQVAWHCMAEGMLLESMAITRAIHDRYHAARRNPWNEVECGDHYARAMAAYGVFLAACGYEHHGPNGHLGFAPRLQPENFKCAFTAAEGWGSFTQQISNDRQRAEIDLKYGRLNLQTLSLGVVGDRAPRRAEVIVGGSTTKARMDYSKGKAVISFNRPVVLNAGDKLTVVLEM
jgi:non-lysosomal glucosylceramidase